MLVGRDLERARVRACLDAAATGASNVLVLPGPPGIGKTSLLRDAVAEAVGWTVLQTSGVRGESPSGYAGLLGLVRPVLPALDALEPGHRVALRRVLGLEEGEPPTFFQVAAATLDLVAHLATEPVLVLVDDLHWLDEQSAAVLLFVARRMRSEPVAFLVGVRQGTPAASQVSDLPTMVVGLLDDDAARACVLAAAPGLPADLVPGLVESAAGNPLALVEGARDLARSLRDDTAPSSGRAGDPFEQRIAECPDDVRDALLVCALESTADRRTLEAALGLLGVVDALPAAETLGLVVLGRDRVELAHPVVGEVVLRTSSPERRRAAHLALAGSIAGHADAAPPWLATWHLGAETDQPDPELAARLEAMGQAVAARGDLATAAHVLRRAADLSGDRERRAQLLVAAGSAAATVGLPWAVPLLEEGRGLAHQPALVAQSDRMQAWVAAWTGDVEAAVRIAERVAAGDDRGLRAFAHGAAGVTAFVGWEPETYHRYATLALADAEGLPSGERFLPDLITLLASFTGPGKVDLRLAHQMADRIVEQPNPDMATPLLQMLVLCDLWDRAREVIAVNLDLARRSALMPSVAWMQTWVAQVELHRGDLAAAEVAASEASELAASLGLAVCRARAEVLLATIATEAGRHEDARRHLTLCLALTTEHRIDVIYGWSGLVETRLALREGDAEGAVARARQTLAHLDRMSWLAPSVLPVHLDLVEALVRLGRHREAEDVLALLVERVTVDPLPSLVASLALGRLMVARDDRLDDAYTAARAAFGPDTDSALPARSALVLGERLRRRGQVQRAVPVLTEALTWFEGRGYAGWARRARQELDAAGTGRSADRTVRPHDTLTPQERQIAALAATGATTREIATGLFLSPKTVEFHLTNVYRKMGVRSKTELASRWP